MKAGEENKEERRYSYCKGRKEERIEENKRGQMVSRKRKLKKKKNG